MLKCMQPSLQHKIGYLEDVNKIQTSVIDHLVSKCKIVLILRKMGQTPDSSKTFHEKY